MTPLEMYMNGVATGMPLIITRAVHDRIPRAHHPVVRLSVVQGRGSAASQVPDLVSGTTRTPQVRTTTLVFVWLSSEPFPSDPLRLGLCHSETLSSDFSETPGRSQKRHGASRPVSAQGCLCGHGWTHRIAKGDILLFDAGMGPCCAVSFSLRVRICGGLCSRTYLRSIAIPLTAEPPGATHLKLLEAARRAGVCAATVALTGGLAPCRFYSHQRNRKRGTFYFLMRGWGRAVRFP